MTTTKNPTRYLDMTASTGRDLNRAVLAAQMGNDLLCVSGGRMLRANDSMVVLPVAAGYVVVITLEADDTYTVTRALRRKGQYIIKGEMRNVYAENVGDVAYYASNFRDGAWGE